MKPLLLCVALLAAVTTAAGNAVAQYPERPIRLVVPQAAGSATDNVSRTLAPELSKQLGQNVVVDNRPGGALTIGIDIVAKSPPDGYTIGQGPVGALAITRHMVAKLPYDIERDLQPVALVTTGYMLLAVSPKTPFHSVKELIDYAKKNPGKLSNASSSNGSPGHVSGELFKYMTGTEIVHVPYKGGAPAIADLIAGNVELMFESTNSIAPHVRAGRVRALAVTGLKRSISLPEVPTLVEAGVPGYEVNAWSGVIAPAGLPRPILDKLNKAINARHRRARDAAALRAARQRGRRRHAGGVRRAHPPRLGQMGRRGQALRREDRLGKRKKLLPRDRHFCGQDLAVHRIGDVERLPLNAMLVIRRCASPPWMRCVGSNVGVEAPHADAEVADEQAVFGVHLDAVGAGCAARELDRDARLGERAAGHERQAPDLLRARDGDVDLRVLSYSA